MAVAEISVLPVGTPTASVSAYVADCVRVLERSGLDYRVTPMGTVIEGSLNDILRVVRQMHEVPFDKGVQRVVTTLKIDDRRDKALTMAGKVEAVTAKLGRK
ncbi:MAG: MTH1187 family thiamine-binding protein [Bacillota bacterium]